ncbi:LIM domain protein, partial [Opisthorchis viverrini]
VNDHLKFRQTCEADDSKQQHQEGEQSEDTKVAAAKAAQQLDDLLFSLGQFKLEQQKRQQHPSPSADFDVHSAPTDSVDGTPAQTTSVDTNHTENNLSRGRTTNGKLQRQPARRIVALPNDMANDVNNDSSVQGPNHVLSSMMSDLSNELAQQGAITAPKGFCFACKKPIVGMLISAMDKYWHPDHFTCTNCGVGLVRANFYERDSQPYCTDCHARLFSPKCANCGEAILEPVSEVVYQGIEFALPGITESNNSGKFRAYTHKCARINASSPWVERGTQNIFFAMAATVASQDNCRSKRALIQNYPHSIRQFDLFNIIFTFFSSACYLERFGTRCSGCNRTITDSYITALDVPWHRACFVCQDCGKSLSGSNFHEVDGYPFCEAHFYQRRGLLCYACSKPITGRCVNALGRRYHPEHFKLYKREHLKSIRANLIVISVLLSYLANDPF